MGKAAEAMAASMNGNGTATPAAPKKGGTRPDQKRVKAPGGAGGKGAVLPPVKGGSLTALPAGEATVEEYSGLTFEADMQKRTVIYDEFTVEKYTEIYQEAIAKKAEDATKPEPYDALPPLRAIKIEDGERIVYDGFQRGEALRRAKLDHCRVIVTPGTREDAEFYALRANAEHGLARSSDDCRKAFFSALDNEAIFARIEVEKDRYGGLNRALAAACGISKGSVSNFLRLKGKTIRGGKIVNLPKPAEPAPVAPVDSAEQPGSLFAADPVIGPLTGEALVAHLNSLSAGGGMTEAEQAAHIKATATRLVAHEALMCAAKLARLCESLILRPDSAPTLREAARTSGIPFRVTEELGKTESFGKDTGTVVKHEEWPVMQAIIGALEMVKEAVAEKPAAAPAEPAPAKRGGKKAAAK